MTASLLVGMLAAALAQQTDTTFEIRPNARVEVETFGGRIVVRTWDRNSIRVQATHGRRDVIEIDSRGSNVSIEAEGRMGPAMATDFTITVPPSVALDLSGVHTEISVEGVQGDIDAETVQGSIRVNGGNRVRLESVEGEIIVARARGPVSANTVNRGIRISDVAGDVSAETVNGPIVLQRIQASVVDAATVNGRIMFDGAFRERGNYSFSTHNGAIWLTVPENTNATVEIATFSGEVDSSFPVPVRGTKERRVNFVLGNGRARIDLESFMGTIYLRRPGESRPTGNENR